MFETAEPNFGEGSKRIETGIIWIDGESGLGDVDRLVLAEAQIAEVVGLCNVRRHGVAGERQSPVGLPDYFRIVIDLWICPSQIKVNRIGISVARQRGGIVRVDRERPFEQRSRGVIVCPL